MTNPIKFKPGTKLSARVASFGEMAKRFSPQMPSRLVAVHQVDPMAWSRLQTNICMYMSRCLPGDSFVLDPDEILRRYEASRSQIKNITPNGMIVPKRNSILEYNSLVRTFAQIVDSLGIADLIKSWHIPLNVRIKFGDVDQENLKRHHPTEHIHSDSWAGESSESVTVHVPLFGDTARNHVQFYDPPEDFDEEWLRPLPTYETGAAVAERYRKIDFIPRNGIFILADFATLHASTRLKGAGPRVSIDTTFTLKRPRTSEEQERVHPWREGERAPHEVLLGLGEKNLFLFPDAPDQQVDSQGGFKHATNLHLSKLLD